MFALRDDRPRKDCIDSFIGKQKALEILCDMETLSYNGMACYCDAVTQ
jgi:hypothetical protein